MEAELRLAAHPRSSLTSGKQALEMRSNQTCYQGRWSKKVQPSQKSVWNNMLQASDSLNYISRKPCLHVHKDVHGSTVYRPKA